ncbi:hypothetical protein GCM10023065_13340 [Microbacterium laevaniformans]|nr:heavy-metal-associated domain-containing protein [Microbacterium laevaniformans]MBM7752283.1 copper chaperone CopZ [Microbacterium laevaniformans]GLJ64662.1 hypothetical protein GCM10017578_15510 [Microbacterium laevaniformans]
MAGPTYQDLGLQETRGGGCACCTPNSHAADAPTAPEREAVTRSVSAEFLVVGMTCGHCVRSVTEEVTAIDGVSEVAVSLNANGVSTLTVSSAIPLERGLVRAAVEEAGYHLAPTS